MIKFVFVPLQNTHLAVITFHLLCREQIRLTEYIKWMSAVPSVLCSLVTSSF